MRASGAPVVVSLILDPSISVPQKLVAHLPLVTRVGPVFSIAPSMHCSTTARQSGRAFLLREPQYPSSGTPDTGHSEPVLGQEQLLVALARLA
jgi:hypothetical protein